MLDTRHAGEVAVADILQPSTSLNVPWGTPKFLARGDAFSSGAVGMVEECELELLTSPPPFSLVEWVAIVASDGEGAFVDERAVSAFLDDAAAKKSNLQIYLPGRVYGEAAKVIRPVIAKEHDLIRAEELWRIEFSSQAAGQKEVRHHKGSVPHVYQPALDITMSDAVGLECIGE